mgnify:CR=1 FL=1
MDVYNDLQEDISLKNEIESFTSSQSLFHIYSDILQESGLVGEDEVVEINSMQSDIIISGFSRDLERKRLNIFCTHYSFDSLPKKIYSKDLQKTFRNYIELFFTYIHVNIDDFDKGDPIIELAEDLHKRRINYNKLTLWYLTNDSYSSRANEVLIEEDGGLEIEFKVFDINAYVKLINDQLKSEIHIQTDIQALKVIDNDSYTSYLFSLSGYELVQFYDDFGKTLLESNVRTFLSLKKKVNKGIHNTIISDIDRPFFFAYNNGITATASSIEFSNGIIKSIKDLQIVNGGQTISTLYNAWKNEKATLDEIYIQVKLSVIHVKNSYTEFVSRISRFANTQNKVEDSDFFGSSYYHKKMKSLSTTIRVAIPGSISTQKWFYERLRGEYQNDQMYKKESEKRSFLKEYPKSNVFDKIAISKAYLSVEQHPHLVSKGAQLCFAEFAKRVSDLYEDGSEDVNDYLFKKSVSQIILFRDVEKIVGQAHWYTKGYRAQTVTYTIALFNKLVTEEKLLINWSNIWETQSISLTLESALNKLGEKIHNIIINPPEFETNIGTYCKKLACWNRLKEHNFALDFNSLKEDLESIVKEKDKKNVAKKIEKEYSGIEAQIEILKLAGKKVGRSDLPNELAAHYNSKYASGITDIHRGVLQSWSQGRIAYPTEKQALILIKLLQKAENDGFRHE